MELDELIRISGRKLKSKKAEVVHRAYPALQRDIEGVLDILRLGGRAGDVGPDQSCS